MNNPQNKSPLFNIAPLLPPLSRLKIVDVGAMSLGEGTDAYFPPLNGDALRCLRF